MLQVSSGHYGSGFVQNVYVGLAVIGFVGFVEDFLFEVKHFLLHLASSSFSSDASSSMLCVGKFCSSIV